MNAGNRVRRNIAGHLKLLQNGSVPRMDLVDGTRKSLIRSVVYTRVQTLTAGHQSLKLGA